MSDTSGSGAALAVRGKNGEDGTIQGLFELAGINYVGTGVIASSVGMDKTFTKIIFENAGIPQAKWITILNHEKNILDKKIKEAEDLPHLPYSSKQQSKPR